MKNPVIFKLKLLQQGPIKLKKTTHVMSVVVGCFNFNGNDEYDEAIKKLGYPRDVFREKNADIGAKLRRPYILVYDTMPLDPGRKLSYLQCQKCTEFNDLGQHGNYPVTCWLKPTFM